MNIHEIPAADLEEWLDAKAKERVWSKSTKKNYITLFSSLWSVAIDKGWATLNICDRLEPVGKITVKVEIFPNDVTRNIIVPSRGNR